MGANPDAVLIAGAGTPRRCPHKELKARGYKGKIYQTHGVANADFLRVCGKDGNGAIPAGGPDARVRSNCLTRNPVKKSSADYISEVREGVRRGLARDVRRPRVGCRPCC